MCCHLKRGTDMCWNRSNEGEPEEDSMQVGLQK
jgi:hypothetical protein